MIGDQGCNDGGPLPPHDSTIAAAGADDRGDGGRTSDVNGGDEAAGRIEARARERLYQLADLLGVPVEDFFHAEPVPARTPEPGTDVG